MNDIKYPKTELFVVLGTKTYPLYTTVDPQTVHELLTQTEGREKFLSFEVATKKNHGNGLWYPGCDEDPVWTKWTVQKRTVKSYLELPKPKVNIDYGNQKYDCDIEDRPWL